MPLHMYKMKRLWNRYKMTRPSTANAGEKVFIYMLYYVNLFIFALTLV